MTELEYINELEDQNLSITELTNRLQNALNNGKNIATFPLEEGETKNSRNYKSMENVVKINVIKNILINKIEFI